MGILERLIEIARQVRMSRPLAGGGITTQQTANGIVIHAADRPEQPVIVPAKLTARTDSTTYTGDIYADGTAHAATFTGATIKLLQDDDGADLTDAWLWIRQTSLSVGGSPEVHWVPIALISATNDKYAAVNASDAPDYLEGQFYPLTTEQSPSGVAGTVQFEVVDQTGDKKIIADVRLDAANAYGLIKDTSTPAAPTLRVRVKRSIEFDSGEVQLVNDEAAPGNSHVYGTDGSGSKSWRSLIELLSTVSGYDSGATQYLKHESGTLKWVTATTGCS